MIKKYSKQDLSVVKRKRRRNAQSGKKHRKKLGPKSHLRVFKK